MRIVLQRVTQAAVRVEGKEIARIGKGFLLLVAVGSADQEEELVHWARKIPELRVFRDAAGRMNRSLRDVGGSVLCVSQFTLYGDCRKGRRPSFAQAAPPELALPQFDRFVELLRDEGVEVQTGSFGAMMDVALINDGPVTLILERVRGQ